MQRCASDWTTAQELTSLAAVMVNLDKSVGEVAMWILILRGGTRRYVPPSFKGKTPRRFTAWRRKYHIGILRHKTGWPIGSRMIVPTLFLFIVVRFVSVSSVCHNND